jgi:hypothetical protein
MWMKLFDSSATLSESPYGIVTTREGGFAIFGGTSTSSASNMRLLVLDSAGNKLIDKLYGTGSSWAYDGIQCSDGGYALAGYVATQTTEKAQFVRTDAKGKQKWIKQYNGDGLAWGYALFQHNNQLVLIGGTKLPSTSTSDMWVLYADSNGVIASYDTIRPGLLFTFNSAQVTWVAGEIDTVHGWVQNLSTDSAHFNFTRQIKSKLPGTFFSNIYFGIAGSSGDMNSSPIGIGPLETLPIIDLLANYDAANGDTAMICYTLQPIGEGATGPSERCITEYPQVVGFVDVSEQNGPLSLSIFPNPLSSSALHTTIVSNTPIQRVEVFDCLGNKVRTLISAASASLQWDVKDGSGNPLPAGVYYLRAITASGSVGANVIVQ